MRRENEAVAADGLDGIFQGALIEHLPVRQTIRDGFATGRRQTDAQEQSEHEPATEAEAAQTRLDPSLSGVCQRGDGRSGRFAEELLDEHCQRERLLHVAFNLDLPVQERLLGQLLATDQTNECCRIDAIGHFWNGADAALDGQNLLAAATERPLSAVCTADVQGEAKSGRQGASQRRTLYLLRQNAFKVMNTLLRSGEWRVASGE